MESYLTMTQLNDFTFCPRSIYFCDIFRTNVSADVYHQAPQKKGLVAHRSIDDGSYSTRKDVLCGLVVYSEKYRLVGRIDVFDTRSGVLTERKYSITVVYPGFRYQLYAQYFALTEMGYDVCFLRLHSSKDNRTYAIDIPDVDDILAFEALLKAMRQFSIADPFTPNTVKCARCIYAPLCDMPDREG